MYRKTGNSQKQQFFFEFPAFFIFWKKKSRGTWEIQRAANSKFFQSFFTVYFTINPEQIHEIPNDYCAITIQSSLYISHPNIYINIMIRYTEF